MRMILLYYKCTFALFIFRLHKLGIEAHAYAHYTSLLYFALLCFALVATVFVHFHKNKFKFLYKHKTAWLLSSRYSVSLRARHSVGSRGKALTNTIQNTIHSLVNSPVVNFHISGTKRASPGTRDTVGQFRDDPGHSGMVDMPSDNPTLNFRVHKWCFWYSVIYSGLADLFGTGSRSGVLYNDDDEVTLNFEFWGGHRGLAWVRISTLC